MVEPERQDGERSVPSLHPRDPAGAAGLRFVMEVVAWVAIFFAWGPLPALVAVIALGFFSTPGDKRRVFVATPGPIRLAIELGILGAGCVAAWVAAGWTAGVPATLLFLGYLWTGRTRLGWLASGAPRD